MLYWIIPLALLSGGGLFIGVRSVIVNQQNKNRQAYKLEFEIGPITLQ